jgi:hypothetical protein
MLLEVALALCRWLQTLPSQYGLYTSPPLLFPFPIKQVTPRKTLSAMPKSILVSQFFLPPSAVSLGRFVTSLDNPHQNFHEPTSIVNPNCTEKVQTQFDSLQHSTKHRNLGSRLTTFLSSSFTKRLKASVRITADQAKTHYLINAGEWFRDATKSQETCKWIERTIHEGEDIYFVVAYHTLMNAQIVGQLGGQSSTGGTLAVPASTLLTESGVVVPFDMADPGFGASSSRVEDEQRKFVAPGEQIYAVQYRRVSWIWFSRDKVNEMTLRTKLWWKEYYTVRTFQSEPEDALEVKLENEIVLDGDHEEYMVESGDTFVSIV